MEPLEKRLLVIIVLFADIIINKTSTTHFETSTSQWQPVLKTRNITKDWKAAKEHKTSAVASQDDLLATSSVRRDSTSKPSPKYQRAVTEPMIHDIDHHTYYDTHSAPPHSGARYEPLADADSYYHPPYPSGPPGPHIYGPPYGQPPFVPPAFPEESIRIKLNYDNIVVRCIVQEPLEHIVWTRYSCPNDYFYGNGQPVAEGSVSHNTDLYEVHIVGDKGEIASELLLKVALDPSTSGLYICEAYPHYHKPENSYGHYQPPLFPSLTDAFIIGGGELIDQCYANHKTPFMQKPFTFKKRHDNDDPDTNHNSAQTKSTKTSNIDTIRKPRNFTTFTNQKLGIIDVNKDKFIEPLQPKSKERQLIYHDKEHRYNFKIANKTAMLNITAEEAFNHFNLLKTFDNNQLNNSKPTNLSSKNTSQILNETHITNSNINFLINRVKLTDQLSMEQNNNTPKMLNWTFNIKPKLSDSNNTGLLI